MTQDDKYEFRGYHSVGCSIRKDRDCDCSLNRLLDKFERIPAKPSLECPVCGVICSIYDIKKLA